MTTNQKRHPAFTDLDRMPFGKHKDEPLQDVPAHYLQWLWNDGLHEWSRNTAEIDVKPPDVQMRIRLANYIYNSKDAIAQETGETL